jgi:prepilin-type N-terminal cleavage/methylation domain-containing protein
MRRVFEISGKAFSLIEVVAAVAVFAIGMVAVLGLFAPVSKSVAASAEAEAAARVADAVRARLSTLPFASALPLIQLPADVQKNDGDVTYNPADGTKHPAVIFARLNGEIGIYDAEAKAWRDSSQQPIHDAQKFFEVDLIRNETLSPAEADATALLVAYNVRVRWPAFQSTAPGVVVQPGASPGTQVPFDQSRKQVLFFTGFIAR